MIIAIDFDGTIAEHAGDGIGPEIPDSIDTIKLIQEKHTTILWTCRSGKWLDEATKWLRERGIYFDTVNSNIYPLTSRGEEYWPRKVFAHYYIDDKAIGGLIAWKTIANIFRQEGLL